MRHRQLDLSLLITEQDVQPLLKRFEDAGWAIEESTLMDLARDNASSNHWKDLIWEYLEAKKLEAPNEEDAPAADDESEQKPSRIRSSRKKKDGDKE